MLFLIKKKSTAEKTPALETLKNSIHRVTVIIIILSVIFSFVIIYLFIFFYFFVGFMLSTKA